MPPALLRPKQDIRTQGHKKLFFCTSVGRWSERPVPIGRLSSRRFLNRRAKGIKKESVCKDANLSGSRLSDGK